MKIKQRFHLGKIHSKVDGNYHYSQYSRKCHMLQYILDLQGIIKNPYTINFSTSARQFLVLL